MANYPAEEIQKVSASSYDDLLDFASKAKGIERQRLEEVMDNIASWESDYYNKENPIPNAKQVGGGPGRGAFQFEILTKDKQGKYGQPAAITAVNRLRNFYKNELGIPQPQWLQNLQIKYREPKNYKEASQNFDPSSLTYEQQKMLFLGDVIMAGGGKSRPLEKINEMSLGDWWGKYHKTNATPEQIQEFNNNVNKRYSIQRLNQQDIPIDLNTSNWIG